MNHVYKIIETLSKEECRNFKILLKRTNNNEQRKDVALFDYVRKNDTNALEEAVFVKKYYNKDKNAFYRLKNRLQHDMNKSLLFFHHNSDDYLTTINYFLLAKIFNKKASFQLTFEYLLEAEKRAIKNEFFDLLDIVYNDLINLSIETVKFNPSPFIEKRKGNRILLNTIQQIDDVLATLTYKIKTTQNYDSNESTKMLEDGLYALVEDKELKKSKQLQFKVYHSLSKILLQQHNFVLLETYLKKTYHQFIKDKLFTKSTHETKLQMITYLVNSLFKNEKIEESLQYTEKLHQAMREFNNLFYNKYLFYYYNSLVINYQATDKPKAIAILEEAKSNKEIQALPIYNLFIYFSVRDKSYLYYVVYIICILLTQTSLQGYTFQYLWFNNPLITKYSLIVLPSLSGITGMFFMNVFLKTKEYYKKLNAIATVLAFPYLFSIVISLFDAFDLSQIIIQLNSGIVFLYMLITPIIIYKKGFQPAKYFIVAWSVF
ncbi:MAG: hypothetical protein CVT95_03820, partial [Bacteroidetes bacterium HGW-Bacteroidetes-12]